MQNVLDFVILENMPFEGWRVLVLMLRWTVNDIGVERLKYVMKNAYSPFIFSEIRLYLHVYI